MPTMAERQEKKTHRYILRKTKPEVKLLDSYLKESLRCKYPITENEYLSIVEYFGDISQRNRALLGLLANTLSVIQRIGRLKVLQKEGDEVFNVNRYDIEVLQTLKRIVPMEIINEPKGGEHEDIHDSGSNPAQLRTL